MSYFVMTCHGVYPCAVLESGPDRSDPPWLSGQPIKGPIDGPLVYTLDVSRPGNLPAMFDDTEYPIMSATLIDALTAAGVDNLQLFDAVLLDPATGSEHRNYKAFNIIGAIAAADIGNSIRASSSTSTIIDADFDRLAIDPNKARGARLFRLAESVDAIIVDEVVKNEVTNRNIAGMTFYDPQDWAG